MSPLKEFAHFLTLNTASLIATYTRLLQESGQGYETFPAESCTLSARKLIQAVVEACEAAHPEPFAQLFNPQTGASQRWPQTIIPPQPMAELECLGQTLTPVVTSLEAGQFLWQMLATVRLQLWSAGPVEAAFRPAEAGLSTGEDETPYRALFEDSHDPIFITTPAGQFLEFNQAMLDTLGYSAAEVRVLSVADIYANPADWARFQEMLEQRSTVRDYELKVRKKDGGVIDCLLTGTLQRDSEDRVLSYQGIVRDVTERKRAETALAKRAAELETVARVSTATTSILDIDLLLQEVVNLTRDNFNLYHVHIYLLDEVGETLVLAAGAGEVGRQMVGQGWRISLAQEHSLVARAARTRQGVTANDVRQAPDWLPNPLLPETRSEMALPMIVGDQVLGVLDVQSASVDHFTEEDVLIQTSLAAQVAVALQNARLFAGMQATLTEMEQSQDLLRSVIDATPDWIFIKDREHRYRLVNQGYANSLHIAPADFIGKNDLELGFPEDIVKGNPEKGIRGFWPDDQEVMDKGQPKYVDSEPAVVNGQSVFLNTIKAPLRNAEGQVWGVLGYVRDITERELLLTQVQRRARNEETIRQITQRLRQAPTLDILAKMAAEELAQALGATHSLVRVGAAPAAPINHVERKSPQ